MRIGSHVINYKFGDEITIIPIGDMHIGNKNSDIDAIKKVIKTIEENGYYWIGMGDYADSIIPKDRRYDYDVLDKRFATPQEQLEYLEDLFYPIREKCLGLLSGNHEDVIRRISQFDLTKTLCKLLNVEYLGYNTFYRLKFIREGRRRKLDFFATHGFFNGRTRSGRITRVEKLAEFIEADLYLMGHTHDLMVTTDIIYKLNSATKLTEKERTFVLTGGFLRGYVDKRDFGYIERKLLKPVKVGVPIIRTNPETLKVRVELDGIG